MVERAAAAFALLFGNKYRVESAIGDRVERYRRNECNGNRETNAEDSRTRISWR
jgi:hypothetical protein